VDRECDEHYAGLRALQCFDVEVDDVLFKTFLSQHRAVLYCFDLTPDKPYLVFLGIEEASGSVVSYWCRL
jgi:hypothetical protein